MALSNECKKNLAAIEWAANNKTPLNKEILEHTERCADCKKSAEFAQHFIDAPEGVICDVQFG